MTSILSVNSPFNNARNTTPFYLAPGNSFDSVSDLLGLRNIKENYLSPHARALLQVMFTYNCRVGELLSISTKSIIRGSKAVVKGLKGSASYTIFLPNVNSCFPRYKKGMRAYKIFPFSYMQVYRWCLKSNIYATLLDHENRAVTHVSRYIVADDIQNSNAPVEVSDLLKHRNPANSKFYLNKGVNNRG